MISKTHHSNGQLAVSRKSSPKSLKAASGMSGVGLFIYLAFSVKSFCMTNRLSIGHGLRAVSHDVLINFEITMMTINLNPCRLFYPFIIFLNKAERVSPNVGQVTLVTGSSSRPLC